MDLNHELRRQVAGLARDLYAGKMDYRAFLAQLPSAADETEDEELCELLDMIEHEPAIGGLLGLPRQQHADYISRIQMLIQRLSGPEMKDEKPSANQIR